MEQTILTTKRVRRVWWARFAPAFCVLAILLVVYWPVLTELVRDWIRDANYNHGFLSPLLSAYLLWTQRQRLRQLSLKSSIGHLTRASSHERGSGAPP